MKIKVGDKVKIIAGADKGKEGVVQKVLPKVERVVVEGVNVHKKNRKPTQQNPEGSVLEIYVPIHISNVALVDPKTKKVTRVHYQVDEKTGKKIRVSNAGNKLD
ncbi:MAG: 50S ribosomal protein L24 [Bacilli bacterium]|jgi:large subunit ribosomal protein L24|nr:50S ribosomal protein L24 [Bacilli bacterium]MDD3388975.1 50S ribosomal protein L24 [Bacilli bacterium]MDD4344414.1 50S ribosomal protein L24 [Bacilli bacterium]MDD4520682.1 50S ribosomal protein L24 [Bacilli bacterium]MDY0399343.1 50S ribosomal protein L24 [Bacilli bacterium]